MNDVLYDGTGLPPEDAEELEQAPGPDQTLDVPDGNEEQHLDWIRAGEDTDDRKARADAVWAKAQETGLSEEDSARLSGYLTAAVYTDHREPTPNPEDGQAPKSDGDGPPYEGGANLSGPDAGTGTDNPDAVAVPEDTRTPDEVEADRNAEGNSGDIASGAYVEGAESLTGSATPLDTPAPFDPEQSEQQPT